MTDNYRDITNPRELDALMLRTGLGIQFANYEPEENVFLAAHGEHDSFLLARHTGEVFAWLVEAGDKDERKALAEQIRAAIKS